MVNKISTIRYKRQIRPLLSKIHTLNDLYSKNPLLFEFDISKIDINKPIKSPDADYHPRKRTKTVLLEESLEPDFYNPRTPEERLKSLKHYVSSELFKAYTELLSILKPVLISLAPSDCSWTLATRCAFEIGKEMAESTTTTYYRLNNVHLFDPDLVNPSIKELYDELYGDIDDWIDMEPAQVTNNYRQYLLIGYVSKLLVIHSQTTLYIFLPVLLHWLSHQNPYLRHLGQLLANDFFSFPDNSTTNIEELNGLKFNNTSRIFWTLYGVDYWKPFLNRASLSVVLPYKISLELFDELEGTHQLPKGYYRRELYSMFQICLNYNIIVMIMVKILQKTRKKCKTYEDAYQHFKNIYTLAVEMACNWLPFYSITFPNNKIIFNSLRQLQEFMQGKLKVLSSQGGKYTLLYKRSQGFFESLEAILYYYLYPDRKITLNSVDTVAKTAVKLRIDNHKFLAWLNRNAF